MLKGKVASLPIAINYFINCAAGDVSSLCVSVRDLPIMPEYFEHNGSLKALSIMPA